MNMLIFFILAICILLFIVSIIRSSNKETTDTVNKEEIEETEEIEWETDEEGREFINIANIRNIPRKTFLSGNLIGKFWGEEDIANQSQSSNKKFFNFIFYRNDMNG